LKSSTDSFTQFERQTYHLVTGVTGTASHDVEQKELTAHVRFLSFSDYDVSCVALKLSHIDKSINSKIRLRHEKSQSCNELYCVKM
ncbi:penicillin-binding protein, partial [Trichinella spiralis]|uniref:penicillin-binding protein n=1 Tax=Trichinella spiralis TaxID=6334 RepID=UPI0001EFC6E1